MMLVIIIARIRYAVSQHLFSTLIRTCKIMPSYPPLLQRYAINQSPVKTSLVEQSGSRVLYFLRLPASKIRRVIFRTCFSSFLKVLENDMLHSTFNRYW